MVAWRVVVGSMLLALVACDSPPVARAPDAGPDVDVWVTLRGGTINALGGGSPSCVLCSYIHMLEFQDADGTAVEWRQREVPEGLAWSAPVQAGGAVSVSTVSISSPTSRYSSTKTIMGVEPGDHLFDRGLRTLPADCVQRTVDVIPDAQGSHWDDPAAASVVARVIDVSSGGASSGHRIVDGETATTIPYRTEQSGRVPPTYVAVDVISCTATNYAALRPLL